MARDASVSEVAKRVYWREADGRVVVDAWRSSGETMSRFARRHRVERERLVRWVRRLGGAGGGELKFHPVRLMEGGPGSGGGESIEIQLAGGPCIRVAHGFEAEDLRRVLLVLAEARC